RLGLCALAVDVEQRHLGALVREKIGHRRAQTRSRARHDDRAPAVFTHSALLPRDARLSPGLAVVDLDHRASYRLGRRRYEEEQGAVELIGRADAFARECGARIAEL